MLDFLRENLLCSSDDSPKRDSGYPRRRPGEVISSQGTPVHPPPPQDLPTIQTLPWDHHLTKQRRTQGDRQRRAHGDRTPSPFRSRWSSGTGSPVGSFRTNPSFRETMGSSLAFNGAAAHQDEGMPARGLYVSMQRGLGGHSAPRRSSAAAETRCGAGTPPSSGTPTVPLDRPGQLVAAVSYEAVHEDTIDQVVEAHARNLPANSGRALHLRRLAAGEYEVDGCRVRIRWRNSEPVVFPAGVRGDDEAKGEVLRSFLHRAADAALARSIMCGGRGPAFVEGHVGLHRAPPAAAMPWSSGGSFLIGPDGGCSFLLDNRTEAGSPYGSFYGLPDPKDPRMQAMRIAGTPSPMQAAPPLASVQTEMGPNPLLRGGSSGSFVLRTDGMRQQSGGGQQRGNSRTPTMPSGGYPSQQARGGRGLPQRQPTHGKINPTLVYGPAFIAVNG